MTTNMYVQRFGGGNCAKEVAAAEEKRYETTQWRFFVVFVAVLGCGDMCVFVLVLMDLVFLFLCNRVPLVSEMSV